MPIILESNQQPSQPNLLTDREQRWVSRLRLLLKDVPMENYHSLNTLVEDKWGERWTDVQLLAYIDQALSELNSEPPLTVYDLTNAPDSWRGCVINGGMIYALIAEGILQVGRVTELNIA